MHYKCRVLSLGPVDDGLQRAGSSLGSLGPIQFRWATKFARPPSAEARPRLEVSITYGYHWTKCTEGLTCTARVETGSKVRLLCCVTALPY